VSASHSANFLVSIESDVATLNQAFISVVCRSSSGSESDNATIVLQFEDLATRENLREVSSYRNACGGCGYFVHLRHLAVELVRDFQGRLCFHPYLTV
jgi:hypothetical protein